MEHIEYFMSMLGHADMYYLGFGMVTWTVLYLIVDRQIRR